MGQRFGRNRLNKMVKINQNNCIGCGICANICPQGIEIVEGKARIKDENAECLEDAANACPRGVILLDSQDKEVREIGGTRFGQSFSQGRGFRRGISGGRGHGAGRRMG
jgi:ferredoxin